MILKTGKPLPKFFGNQWTKRTFLSYNKKEQRCIEFCLKIIFCGHVQHRENGFTVCFQKHADYLKEWFTKTFDLWIQGASAHSHRGKYHFGFAKAFIEGAKADGWRFGQDDWHIPEWVTAQYPALVLQHWLGLQANFFLFVQREDLQDKALTINQKCKNIQGLHDISRVLTRFGIQHSIAVQESEGTWTPTSPRKTLYTLSIYQIQNIQRMFEKVGWDSPYYQNHKIRAIQMYIKRNLFEEVKKRP